MQRLTCIHRDPGVMWLWCASQPRKLQPPQPPIPSPPPTSPQLPGKPPKPPLKPSAPPRAPGAPQVSDPISRSQLECVIRCLNGSRAPAPKRSKVHGQSSALGAAPDAFGGEVQRLFAGERRLMYIAEVRVARFAASFRMLFSSRCAIAGSLVGSFVCMQRNGSDFSHAPKSCST